MPTPYFEAPREPVRKFSVDEYHRMIASGILAENNSVELLDGWIVSKSPHNPLHVSTVQRINNRLRAHLPAGWDLRIQSAITLDESEPEPDVAVVYGDHATFRHRHPTPADLGLVIEVAESSLAQDRTDKYAIYARAGIANYWIVNLVDSRIEAFAQPRNAFQSHIYRKHSQFLTGESVPLTLVGNRLNIPVDDLFALA
jgi:Uma2 family endonuclease